ICAAPLPSRSTRPAIRVSLVFLSTVAMRTMYSPRGPRQRRRPFNNFLQQIPQSVAGGPELDRGSVHLTSQFSEKLPTFQFLGFPPRGHRIGKRRVDHPGSPVGHGTTILCLGKGSKVVVAGDGQVTMGQTVVKSNARKLRRLAGGSVIAGFAGATADAI